MGRARRTAVPILLVALLAGCAPPLPHPLAETTRYLCCNVRYEKPTITDVNFQRGTLVPAGTPVRVTRVTNKAVVFEAPGHPPLTLVFRYGRRTMSLEEYLSGILLSTDPRRELARWPADVRGAVEQGRAEPGMTKAQVLMALGYPPAHRTPSLDASEWHYWANRWDEYVVRFDGDRVAATGR